MSLFPETPAFSSSSMLRRDHWLISLRWFAILGLLSGVLLLKLIDLGPPNSILWMGISGGFMILLNLLYLSFASRKRQLDMLSLVTLLNVQMVIDLLLLTFLVYLTGNEESPLIFFYVFHIILASIIFPGGFSYLYSLLVIILFSSLLVLEHTGVVAHTCFFKEIHLSEDFRITIAIWFIFTITMTASAYLAQNVTERHRRVREKLEIANLKLKEVNKTKTTFFRFAGHEMKAPIATIQSTLLVIQEVLGETVDERVDGMLKRAITRTESIIDMLKSLADLTYGSLQEPQKFQHIDIHNLLSELLVDISPNADRKNQTIRYEAINKKTEVEGDEEALKKIFSNLLSNAIRYTPENGEITVKLRRIDLELEISVSDNGPGIPETEQDNIFKEFYRTPSAHKQVSEGSGLGLSIVERMVELHSGTIQVESKNGKGTRFIVRLPVGEIL